MESANFIDQEIEDRFLCALLGHENLLPFVKDALNGDDMSSVYKKAIYEGLVKFHAVNNSVPTSDLLGVELRKAYPDEISSVAVKIIDRVKLIPLPEYSWIVAEIDKWVMLIKMGKAMFVASQKMGTKDVEGAQNELIRAIRSGGLSRGGVNNDLELTNEEISNLADDEAPFACRTRI